MRAELRLILWVTAAGLMGLSVWRGFWPGPQLSVETIETEVANIYQEDSLDLNDVKRGDELWVGALPEIDPGQRVLFPVDTAPVQEIITGSTDVRPVELPILKGIVESAGRRAAVFSMPAGQSPYVVATVGEQFDGYTLVEIRSEQVVTRSAQGEAVIFRLRGSGELP